MNNLIESTVNEVKKAKSDKEIGMIIANVVLIAQMDNSVVEDADEYLHPKIR